VIVGKETIVGAPPSIRTANSMCAVDFLYRVRASGLVMQLLAQEEPLTEQGYEREELGVNLNTARSPRIKYRNS
jgi:hypothetical protein